MPKKKSKLEYLLSIGAPLETWLQNTIVDVGDYFFTFIRLFQVFTNVIANAISNVASKMIDLAQTGANGFTNLISPPQKNPASDAETGGHSRYDHTVHNTNGGLTPAGDAIFISMGFSMLLGAIRGIYQKIHRTRNISTERLIQNRMNLASTETRKDDIKLGSSNVLNIDYPENTNFKVTSKKTRFSGHRIKVTNANDDDIFSDENLAATIAAQNATHKLTRLNLINKVGKSPVGTVAGSAWKFSNNQSMWYWLAWYMRVVATNMTESVSRASVKITVGFTAAIGGVFSFWKYLNWCYRMWKEGTVIGHISKLIFNPNRNDLNDLADNDKANLLKVIRATIPQQDLTTLEAANPKDMDKATFKKRKGYIDKIFKIHHELIANNKATRKHLREAWIQKSFMDEEAKQNAWQLNANAALNPGTALQGVQIPANDVQNTTLRQHLLLKNTGLLNRRTAVATIRNVVIGFAMPFFIFSMLAAATVLFPPLGAAVFAAGVFNSVLIMTITGTVIAAVMGLTTPAAQRQETLDYRAKADAKLKEKVMVNGSSISKETHFTLLETKLNQTIASIRNNPEMLAALQASGYSLEKINVYNDDYFEKQRHEPTRWVKAKKFMKRAYEFVGGGQTGVLITRFLFLSGMVGATLIASVATFGAPLIFLGIAAGLGLALGSLRLAHYRMNRKVAHANKCVEHLDARIKYMEDRTAELQQFIAAQSADPKHTSKQATKKQDQHEGHDSDLRYSSSDELPKDPTSSSETDDSEDSADNSSAPLLGANVDNESMALPQTGQTESVVVMSEAQSAPETKKWVSASSTTNQHSQTLFGVHRVDVAATNAKAAPAKVMVEDAKLEVKEAKVKPSVYQEQVPVFQAKPKKPAVSLPSSGTLFSHKNVIMPKPAITTRGIENNSASPAA